METNSFDLDGVIYFGKDSPGVYPGPSDIIITGRSWEEEEETIKWCDQVGIKNRIIFSKVPVALRTREISGYHKAVTLLGLLKTMNIVRHFEDDPIQKEIIEAIVPEVKVVHLVHELTEK
jgi:hypothetical protein